MILLLAACLVWVGILSTAYVLISGTKIAAAWVVGGGLICAIIAWVLVMFREIHDAIQLPDFFAQGNREDESYDETGESTVARPAIGLAERGMTGRRGMTPFRGTGKTRPRKLRSNRLAVGEASNR